MKYPVAVLTLLLSTLAASEGLSFFGGSQKALGDVGGDPVPGDNPLTFCQKEHDDDILVLDHVNLTPNPPTAGANLTIEAVGTLSKDVREGAYVVIQVKYGLIRLVNQKTDLCNQVANVDLKCPIEKGKITITKDVSLPKEIPPGAYTVFADAYTVNDEKIVCLQASVKFSISN